jgi:cellobiose-specific phosphotransferase system component IIA
MKLFLLIPALLAAILAFTSPVVEAKDPVFAGEPHLNEALKHLTKAKEKISGDTDGALAELQSAEETLSHAIHNKGTYQGIARQFTTQAIDYLKKGDAETASHKIDEALHAVEEGGKTGKHGPGHSD